MELDPNNLQFLQLWAYNIYKSTKTQFVIMQFYFFFHFRVPPEEAFI